MIDKKDDYKKQNQEEQSNEEQEIRFLKRDIFIALILVIVVGEFVIQRFRRISKQNNYEIVLDTNLETSSQ
jgi:hypothetical protein